LHNRSKKPFVPVEREETLRQEIISLLQRGNPVSMRDISQELSISEKEVNAHLEHISRTMHHKGKRLVITPARCSKCGFAFRKRSRLKKPSRCPLCRSESIEEPLYAVKGSSQG